MPIYEYYCHRCQTRFELLRPMSRRDEAATCPQGHEGAERLLSIFAAFRGGEGSTSALGGSGCAGCAGGHCASCHPS
ncbi:MAG: zinc ribbon domain-containing protein [Dehalococcoidia bacterium]|nr:zinc ribbon domain-containing protein [Dehalococcoidia bacterium]